jgi:hypothetical protein
MSSSTTIDKIKTYYENYPDFSQYITSADDNTTTLSKDVKKLEVKDNNVDRVEAFRREFLYIGGPEVIARSKTKNEKNDTPKQNAVPPS